MKLIWQDIVLIASFIFNIGAILSTYGIVASLQHTSGIAVESNPIAKISLSNPLFAILFFSGIYFYVVFIYLLMRRGIAKHNTPQNWYKLNYLVLFIFFLFLLDFVSDFGFLIKLI